MEYKTISKETANQLSLIFFSGLTAGLSADLLYLYFYGSWYDPIQLIEYSEVALLFILVILGIVIFVYNTSKLVTRG
jgi:hypothetical protein